MRVHLIYYGTISQHNFQAKTIGMHRALLYKFDTASIGREVAANLARALGSKVEWDHVAKLFGIVL